MRSRSRTGPAGIAAEVPPAVDSRADVEGSSPTPHRAARPREFTVHIGERIMTVKERTKPQVATMNAVHDLPVLVARDKGYFKDEGLDLEFVTTPGMAQVTDRKSTRLNSSHTVISYAVFCLKKKKKNT